MKSPLTFREGESGVTLLEILILVVVLSIMAGIAIPAFSAWLPEYRLRNAARDIYSTLQRAKSGAANANETWGVFFDNSVNPGNYSVWSFGPNRKWDDGVGDDRIDSNSSSWIRSGTIIPNEFIATNEPKTGLPAIKVSIVTISGRVFFIKKKNF